MTKTTCLKQGLNETFMQELNITLNVTHNPLNLELGSLFQIAARKNPKRNFLFVSKLLGKYIPVPPQIPLLNGLLMVDVFLRAYEAGSPYNHKIIAESLENHAIIPEAMKEFRKESPLLSKKTCFIGFAETATGLGHAMFYPFRKDAAYIHTTRDRMVDLEPLFAFEEEHSHATTHLCYASDPTYFAKFDRIVLVDDEITTGKTALNLIRALNDRYPGKEYIVVSILDWRNNSEIKKFEKLEKDLKLKVTCLSLIRGTIAYTTKKLQFEECVNVSLRSYKMSSETILFPIEQSLQHTHLTINEAGEQKKKTYYELTGRFSKEGKQSHVLDKQIKEFSNLLESKRKSKKSLVVGFGEFIFVPALLASKLSGEIQYHSVGRSPIYALNREDYPIGHAISFQCPEDSSITYYLYNVTPGSHEEVIFILERDIAKETKKILQEKLQELGVRSIIFAAFCNK